MIDFLIHLVQSDTCLFIAVQYGGLDRGCAPVLRKKRRMNADNAIRKCIYNFSGNYFRVSGHNGETRPSNVKSGEFIRLINRNAVLLGQNLRRRGSNDFFPACRPVGIADDARGRETGFNQSFENFRRELRRAEENKIHKT